MADLIDDYGCGPKTVTKFEHFSIFLKHYLSIVGAIQKKHSYAGNFHYVDMNAGPGIINNCMPHVPIGTFGSPLIFLVESEKKAINYHADFIEQNINSFNSLRQNSPSFLNGSVGWHLGDHSNIAPELVRNYIKWKFGLLYNDPNGADNSIDCIYKCLQKRPKYDVLFNISASSFKRVAGRRKQKTSISDYITNPLDKVMWFAKDLLPGDKHQWTMIFGTNYDDMKSIEEIGFYRLDTPQGQKTWNTINNTRPKPKKKESIGHTANIFDILDLDQLDNK